MTVIASGLESCDEEEFEITSGFFSIRAPQLLQ